MMSITHRYCQTGCYYVKWMSEHSRQYIHSALKPNVINRCSSTDSSRKNEHQKEVSTKLAEQKDLQIDTYKQIPQQQATSIPPHDVSRITQESKRLQITADTIFDELSALKGANRKTFLMAVNSYISKETLYRRGSVEFIYAGLQKMKHFGVEKDLMAYKALIQAFPEGRMIPRNIWQVEFMHYPRQQQCGIDLLEQMEYNAIIPDDEFGKLLKDRFGIAAHVTRKYLRMMYWLPKFKNMNPYPIPTTLPADPVELALVALKRMCVDLNTKYNIYKTAELDFTTGDDTYIVSAQSPVQQNLISVHKSDLPLFVEGPYTVYLRATSQQYFILRDEPNINNLMKEKQRRLDEENDDLFEWRGLFEEEHCQEIAPVLSVHEQEDSTILALCITGTGTKSSVVTWVRCLEKDNPNLAKTPVLFKLISQDSEIKAVGDNRPYKELN